MKYKIIYIIIILTVMTFPAAANGNQETETHTPPETPAPPASEASPEPEKKPEATPEAEASDTEHISVGPNGEFQNIQEAIDYARSGEVILIEEGIYEVDDSLYITDKIGITLKGRGIVDIIGTTYVHSLIVKNSTNIIIENLHLVHKMGAEVVSCAGANVIHLEHSDNITITSCELNGCGNIGVNIISCGNVDIRENYIHSNTTAGILVDKYAKAPEKVLIENNRIINNSRLPVSFRGKKIFTDSQTEGLEMRNNSIYPNG